MRSTTAALSLAFYAATAQALLLGARPRAIGTEDSAITAIFGNGCFWGRQHMFTVDFEQAELGRTAAEITSTGGFAGGVHSEHDVCYHNQNDKYDYAEEGHAEVVQVGLPASKLSAAALLYFKSFVEVDTNIWGRSDYFDLGPGYRALIAIPGGIGGPHFGAVQQSNVHNMTLVEGKGSDKDTLGTNSVLILDSASFNFHQADLCLQFHNLQGTAGTPKAYPASYLALTQARIAAGTLRKTSCPTNYVC